MKTLGRVLGLGAVVVSCLSRCAADEDDRARNSSRDLDNATATFICNVIPPGYPFGDSIFTDTYTVPRKRGIAHNRGNTADVGKAIAETRCGCGQPYPVVRECGYPSTSSGWRIISQSGNSELSMKFRR